MTEWFHLSLSARPLRWRCVDRPGSSNGYSWSTKRLRAVSPGMTRRRRENGVLDRSRRLRNGRRNDPPKMRIGNQYTINYSLTRSMDVRTFAQ